eukprot:Trichotokara_eunicae@DN3803_c0_g1_i1.p1
MPTVNLPKDDEYTVRLGKVQKNPLLSRTQCLVTCTHVGKSFVPKVILRERISKIFKVKDPQSIMLFGFRTVFGGGRTRGFACIYESVAALKQIEEKFRIARMGLGEHVRPITRRSKKDLKTARKKLRGTKKEGAVAGGKKK